MQNITHSVDIKKILKLVFPEGEHPLGSDIIIGEVKGSEALGDTRLLDILQYPIRFDGYILFFVKRGRFSIDFNLNSYEIREHSLLIAVPGNIIRLPKLTSDNLSGVEMAFVLVSKEFLSGIHLDFNQVFAESLKILSNPCITLSDSQLPIAESYFSLAKQIYSSPIKNKRQVIGGLITSLSFVTEDIWTDQISAAKENGASASVRSKQIFDSFLALVTEYHTSERGMQFYADRLCLTPKYLSKVIRDASGRSGPEWIDAFVILEAKNLLKYSDSTIKEVVYQLNFPGQSVFNKFFKAHTGMTPSQYRKEA